MQCVPFSRMWNLQIGLIMIQAYIFHSSHSLPMSFQFFRISFYPSGFVHKDLSGYIPKMMMVIYLDIQPERERNIRANDFNSIIVMVDFPLVNQH